MRTVLWANVLVEGRVWSQRVDCVALFVHAEKLDAMAARLRLPSFLDLCDSTDARCRHAQIELPEGLESTDELMARDGRWLAVESAQVLLDGLLAHIRLHRVRFGLVQNAHDEVVRELHTVRTFLREQVARRADRFNFAVVT